MNVRDFAKREVVFAHADDPIIDATQRMREHHVGSLVVVAEKTSKGRRPVGMLTDRDIAIGVVAQAPDRIMELTVGDVMSSDVVTVRWEDDLPLALQRMRVNGVRRAPVVDTDGGLVGILAVDDVLEVVADQLTAIVDLMSRERRREENRRG